MEGLILKLQYLGHLMERANSPEKTLMLGRRKAKGEESKDRWLGSITDSMDMSLSKLWEKVKDREAACCSSWGHKQLDKIEQLNNSNKNYDKNQELILRRK